MKTTLTIMFVVLLGATGIAAKKTDILNTSGANDQQLYACFFYPICTVPDNYSPMTIKDSKDKAEDTSSDKLKLA
ncbi:hypothetical protein [Rheinheimera oceanensis]|uniref:hypothetical protein n=1 Tax=Rheinheimera oceanensis TaxID=2817449 RepID=UPI001BFD90F2|nr:hypothetical protein [Rheinheimera oceanensis]